MSNKLAPIVIPVIVDAAGIDRGMRTAKQKLSSGLGGQGGTDFGGVSGFGSGTRGGGGGFLSRSIATAAGILLANRTPKFHRNPGTLDRNWAEVNRLQSNLKALRPIIPALIRGLPRMAGQIMQDPNISLGTKLKTMGSAGTQLALIMKDRALATGELKLTKAKLTAKGMAAGITASSLGVGASIAATGVIGAVAAATSFRDNVAAGASGLEHLGARGSGLNREAMAIQAGFRSQPVNRGGFTSRAAAMAGEETTMVASWASTVLSTLFSAETVGGIAGMLAAPFNNDTWLGEGSVDDRYTSFLNQQYETWRLGSYGTTEELRAARKEARKATRIAERNAI